MGVISREVVLRMAMIGIIICIVGANSISAYNQEDVVGIWLLDEGEGDVIEDSSGNGHHGTITGILDWVEGKFGSGLKYPGNGANFASVEHRDDLDLVTYTLMAWINIADRGDWQCVVGKEEPFGIGNYSLFINRDALKPVNEFWVAGVYRGIMGKTVVTDEEWHHIAGTYDKSFMKIYVDGVMEGQMAATDDPDTTTGVIRLGVRINGGNAFNGILDEVALFNVALSDSEIKSIMDNGLATDHAVSPSGKTAHTWGDIKAGYRLSVPGKDSR